MVAASWPRPGVAQEAAQERVDIPALVVLVTIVSVLFVVVGVSFWTGWFY